MSFLYLGALLVSLVGMALIDRRWRLFFWADARRAATVLVVGIAFFVMWDVAGIGLGVFFRGRTAFMTGLTVARELPIEELFFLALLCWLTMNVYGALSRVVARSTRATRTSRTDEADAS